MTRFLHGITDEMRQTNRDRVFAARKSDLIDVTKKYFLGKKSSATILGPDNPKIAIDRSFRQVKNLQTPSIGE